MVYASIAKKICIDGTLEEMSSLVRDRWYLK